MTLMGKATEKGLEEVAKTVLGEYFELAGNESGKEVEEIEDDKKKDKLQQEAHSVS